LRDLTAGEVAAGLRSLTGTLSSWSLQIAHQSLRRAIRYAEANGRVGRNVAGLIDSPLPVTGDRMGCFRAAPSGAPARVMGCMGQGTTIHRPAGSSPPGWAHFPA